MCGVWTAKEGRHTCTNGGADPVVPAVVYRDVDWKVGDLRANSFGVGAKYHHNGAERCGNGCLNCMLEQRLAAQRKQLLGTQLAHSGRGAGGQNDDADFWL